MCCVAWKQTKKLREMAKRYVLADIVKRRECVKNLSFGGEATDQLPNIMPDYMLCFAVAVLTHLPLYDTHKDVQVLEQLKSALWFILEPLMVKNENFSLQFYKMLIELMKCHIDASEDPPSDASNHKMWALCDLALTIIMSKATSYNDFNKEFPFKPTIPPLYFKPHTDPNFQNPTTYIPPEMALLPKSKIGLSSIGWQSKRGASGGRRKSDEDEKSIQISGTAVATE